MSRSGPGSTELQFGDEVVMSPVLTEGNLSASFVNGRCFPAVMVHPQHSVGPGETVVLPREFEKCVFTVLRPTEELDGMDDAGGSMAVTYGATVRLAFRTTDQVLRVSGVAEDYEEGAGGGGGGGGGAGDVSGAAQPCLTFGPRVDPVTGVHTPSFAETFRLLPKGRVREEGEVVRAGEQILIESFATGLCLSVGPLFPRAVFSSMLPADAGRSQGRGVALAGAAGGGIETVWRIDAYDLQANQPENSANATVLRVGDSIVLFHKEKEAFLEAIPDGDGGHNVVFAPAKPPKATYSVRDLPQPSSAVWLLESHNIVTGGAILAAGFQTPYRLRHVGTGMYLCCAPCGVQGSGGGGGGGGSGSGAKEAVDTASPRSTDPLRRTRLGASSKPSAGGDGGGNGGDGDDAQSAARAALLGHSAQRHRLRLVKSLIVDEETDYIDDTVVEFHPLDRGDESVKAGGYARLELAGGGKWLHCKRDVVSDTGKLAAAVAPRPIYEDLFAVHLADYSIGNALARLRSMVPVVSACVTVLANPSTYDHWDTVARETLACLPRQYRYLSPVRTQHTRPVDDDDDDYSTGTSSAAEADASQGTPQHQKTGDSGSKHGLKVPANRKKASSFTAGCSPFSTPEAATVRRRRKSFAEGCAIPGGRDGTSLLSAIMKVMTPVLDSTDDSTMRRLGLDTPPPLGTATPRTDEPPSAAGVTLEIDSPTPEKSSAASAAGGASPAPSHLLSESEAVEESEEMPLSEEEDEECVAAAGAAASVGIVSEDDELNRGIVLPEGRTLFASPVSQPSGSGRSGTTRGGSDTSPVAGCSGGEVRESPGEESVSPSAGGESASPESHVESPALGNMSFDTAPQCGVSSPSAMPDLRVVSPSAGSSTAAMSAPSGLLAASGASTFRSPGDGSAAGTSMTMSPLCIGSSKPPETPQSTPLNASDPFNLNLGGTATSCVEKQTSFAASAAAGGGASRSNGSFAASGDMSLMCLPSPADRSVSSAGRSASPLELERVTSFTTSEPPMPSDCGEVDVIGGNSSFAVSAVTETAAAGARDLQPKESDLRLSDSGRSDGSVAGEVNRTRHYNLVISKPSDPSGGSPEAVVEIEVTAASPQSSKSPDGSAAASATAGATAGLAAGADAALPMAPPTVAQPPAQNTPSDRRKGACGLSHLEYAAAAMPPPRLPAATASDLRRGLRSGNDEIVATKASSLSSSEGSPQMRPAGETVVLRHGRNDGHLHHVFDQLKESARKNDVKRLMCAAATVLADLIAFVTGTTLESSGSFEDASSPAVMQPYLAVSAAQAVAAAEAVFGSKMSPIKARQTILFEQGILHLVYELLSAPFKSGRLTLMDLRDPDFALLHIILRLGYRLIMKCVTGYPQASSDVLQYITFFETQSGHRLNATDAIHAIVHNHPGVLSSLRSNTVQHFVQLVPTYGRSPSYLNLLSAVCVCCGIGIARTQDLVCSEVLRLQSVPGKQLLHRTRLTRKRRDSIASNRGIAGGGKRRGGGGGGGGGGVNGGGEHYGYT
eukprot:Rhum_TRINITY_DN14427_c13_g1::Rhum_TRINITY_DN14427_c13_g1_i1::g.89970::m.89970